jgi:AcrR family transcriptional regulator
VSAKRRPSADVRAELLNAASHLFARRGYAGTSTKQIADMAGTFETSLYTHFGSKAGIFSAAVIEPFSHLIDSFRGRLAEQRDVPDEVLIRAFVDDLYDTVEANREAVTAFVIAMREPDASEALAIARRKVEVMFDELHESGRRRAIAAGDTGPGRPLTQRLMVGLVVAASVFSPWLFAGPQPAASSDAIKEAMVGLLTRGVADSAP